MIPETARRPDWPRLVKQEHDRHEGLIRKLEARIAALEAPITKIVFVPTTTPASPVAGMTYMDSTTLKLRTYNGTAWNNLW